MALKLFPAALVAVAALAAASSFAQGAKTRAEVNAELQQAYGQGYSPSSLYAPSVPQTASPRTREDVTAELMQAYHQGYSPIETNPFPPAYK